MTSDTYQDCVESILIHTEIRRARKPQKCGCGKTINPGEQYRREFGLIDGEPFTQKIGNHIHSYDEEA